LCYASSRNNETIAEIKLDCFGVDPFQEKSARSGSVPGQGVEGVKLLLICILVCKVLLATAGPVAAQKADELNQAGLDHLSKGFYDATPRGERAKAAEEYSLAEQSFQAAIGSKPDWVEPYLHLGRTYFVQQKYRQAAEAYQKALTLAPQRKEVYTQWASALEKAGDYQGAVKALQTLRAQETNERTIAKLDEFIKRLQARAQASPTDKEGGR
jgi:tetratricopeptide (TPR) repeat protein